jgi:hypothetical protein
LRFQRRFLTTARLLTTVFAGATAGPVLQVADIFDALTSVRPYKPALSTAEALDILEAEAVRGWRDPKLVGLFRRLFETTVDAAVEQNLIPWPPPEAMEQSLERMHEALAGTNVSNIKN